MADTLKNSLSKEAVRAKIEEEEEEAKRPRRRGIIAELMDGLRKGGPVNRGIRRALDEQIEANERGEPYEPTKKGK